MVINTELHNELLKRNLWLFAKKMFVMSANLQRKHLPCDVICKDNFGHVSQFANKF